jgi:hypothetical protein
VKSKLASPVIEVLEE